MKRSMNASREYGRGATSADHSSDRFLPSKRPHGTRTATRFAIGRAVHAGKLALVLAGALALTIGAAGGASAATPIVNQHTSFTDTFPDTMCGDISGTSTVNVVDNFKLFAGGTFLETTTLQQVFTAQNGKSVVIFAAGQTTGPADPIQNADGTITFTATIKGLPEKISTPGGPTLTRDAGVITRAVTFLPLPNGDLQFVSVDFPGAHGPHPEVASEGELFCNVVIPALS